MSTFDTEERPASLSFETMSLLVAHLNYQLKLLPRLVGSLLAHVEQTSLSEIGSAYKSDKPYSPTGPDKCVPMMQVRGDIRTISLAGMPEVLSLCGDGTEIYIRWHDGVPSLELVKR